VEQQGTSNCRQPGKLIVAKQPTLETGRFESAEKEEETQAFSTVREISNHR
jgi:hypothetical protein